eukprot:CAMPEP_0197236298 /NCGR_PEP_ID=MMETSP1429-20130617/3453_1 /TAXON_ID=49237 /ORGANISM="Chaetoceros  sp., Strain UNC1202" /LENGTH=163 /DNA_ID=CAMNT_0042695053 /DNA_START=24 /DNA_END=515 /DNA_ORIENTATION=-
MSLTLSESQASEGFFGDPYEHAFRKTPTKSRLWVNRNKEGFSSGVFDDFNDFRTTPNPLQMKFTLRNTTSPAYYQCHNYFQGCPQELCIPQPHSLQVESLYSIDSTIPALVLSQSFDDLDGDETSLSSPDEANNCRFLTWITDLVTKFGSGYRCHEDCLIISI